MNHRHCASTCQICRCLASRRSGETSRIDKLHDLIRKGNSVLVEQLERDGFEVSAKRIAELEDARQLIQHRLQRHNTKRLGVRIRQAIADFDFQRFAQILLDGGKSRSPIVYSFSLRQSTLHA